MPHTARLTTPDPSAERGVTQVLILDDERLDRHRLARLCSGLPFKTEITNARSLVEFGTTISSDKFDLILIDYRLPDGTGLDALADIRRSAHNLNAGTIMVSGHAKESIPKKALLSGCTDYLSKDHLTPTAFQSAVVSALQKSKLTIPRGSETFSRQEVEFVLEHFASKSARDIKPAVSRMLRQIRNLRANEDLERLSAIEESCLDMWRSLVALERCNGTGLLQSITSQEHSKRAPEPVRKRKSPSPFSRLPYKESRSKG